MMRLITDESQNGAVMKITCSKGIHFHVYEPLSAWAGTKSPALSWWLSFCSLTKQRSEISPDVTGIPQEVARYKAKAWVMTQVNRKVPSVLMNPLEFYRILRKPVAFMIFIMCFSCYNRSRQWKFCRILSFLQLYHVLIYSVEANVC